MKVLVIGGGTGGLALAHGLKRAGLPATTGTAVVLVTHVVFRSLRAIDIGLEPSIA